MSERQVCHCGHHAVTHAPAGACSGVGCNSPSDDWSSTAVSSPCPWFRDDRQPDTLRMPRVKPLYHPGGCLCYACKVAT